MTERLRAPEPEIAVLVGIARKGGGSHASHNSPRAAEAEESLAELKTLAESAGVRVADSLLQSRERQDAATGIGYGKLEELRARIESHGADLVIFDQELTPAQFRNLEDALGVRVIDRTQLILDIFARRARTREGRLQVELAQLNYLRPRLAGHGVEMSRLGGGIGTRGPGETKLETDRRRIDRRIRKIEKDLERVRRSRGIQRAQRESVPLETVSLVGYTNAGKSTLFNRLTGANVYADDRLFATLDPTVRQLRLPSNRRILVSDTVGFLRNLPTTLVHAFRSTLEEVLSATLLLHVVDASSPSAAAHVEHVRRVLKEIGAHNQPQILVLNKIDLLANMDVTAVEQRILGAAVEGFQTPCAAVSATTGEGLDHLLEMLDKTLPNAAREVRFRFPPQESGKLSLLYAEARVIEVRYLEGAIEVLAQAPEALCCRLAEFRSSGQDVPSSPEADPRGI